jgi:integrase
MRGSYRAEAVQPREIPDIKTITEWGKKIPPDWKFFYFLLACFGLRGTEAHQSNVRLEDLHEGESTVYGAKTKKWRYVPTCSDQLFKALKCEPNWNRDDRTPQQLSYDFGQTLTNRDFPFTPYGLRHHYAYLTLLDGWDTALSSRYMGHSIKIHCDVYWLCIDQVREREIRKKRTQTSASSQP